MWIKRGKTLSNYRAEIQCEAAVISDIKSDSLRRRSNCVSLFLSLITNMNLTILLLSLLHCLLLFVPHPDQKVTKAVCLYCVCAPHFEFVQMPDHSCHISVSPAESHGREHEPQRRRFDTFHTIFFHQVNSRLLWCDASSLRWQVSDSETLRDRNMRTEVSDELHVKTKRILPFNVFMCPLCYLHLLNMKTVLCLQSSEEKCFCC